MEAKMLFELTMAELLAIRYASRADVLDAQSYSTPRNRVFSSFDDPVFLDATHRRSQLQEKLLDDPNLCCSLAGILNPEFLRRMFAGEPGKLKVIARLQETDHDRPLGVIDHLAARLAEYATQRSKQIEEATSQKRYLAQRGTTT